MNLRFGHLRKLRIFFMAELVQEFADMQFADFEKVCLPTSAVCTHILQRKHEAMNNSETAQVI